MLIHTADSIAASRKPTTWGRRWTMRRSAINRVVMVPSSATQARIGTSKETKSACPEDAAAAADDATEETARTGGIIGAPSGLSSGPATVRGGGGSAVPG